MIDDFLTLLNGHKMTYFEPSYILTVDESMVRWYGLGGSWMNKLGPPHYIAIDRKPENCCEIQDTACGMSGVMLKLKIVKSEDHAAAANKAAHHGDVELPQGGQVLKELEGDWANTNILVCADSYFASAAAALELKRIGLKFIGIVKTATKQFPKTYLQTVVMRNRGDSAAVVHRDDNGNLP